MNQKAADSTATKKAGDLASCRKLATPRAVGAAGRKLGDVQAVERQALR